eukprot:Rmarinus@m.8049
MESADSEEVTPSKKKPKKAKGTKTADATATPSEGKKEKKGKKSDIGANQDNHGEKGDSDNDTLVISTPTATPSKEVSLENGGTSAGDDTPPAKRRRTNDPFQRVRTEDVQKSAKARAFLTNSISALHNMENELANEDHGSKAHEILEQVVGRGFRHEKTKKKRSYHGGRISQDVRSVLLDDSD